VKQIPAALFDLQQIPRGAREEFRLEFDAAGERYAFNLLVARGAQPGPTLLVTAAVHGDEFEGVRAIFDVWHNLDTAEMSGDLLAIPVLNETAFWNGSRTSPVDSANLARVFPGRIDGPVSEALAWNFDQHVLPLATLYVDLHSAGIRCEMPTLAGYDASDHRSREAAQVFGAPVLWGHPNIPPGRTVSAAKARDIPAIYIEARGAGRIHPGDLAIYRTGLRNLLRYLGILPGAPETRPCETHLFGNGDLDESAAAASDGFLVPDVNVLDDVEAGALLGRLLDLHGHVIEEYRAPRSGKVALVHACPLTKAGEPVFLVTGTLG